MSGGVLGVLRDAWRLALPYFRSEERWAARLLLGGTIGLNLAIVGLNVLLNVWQGAFMNSLQNKDAQAFLDLMLFWRSDETGDMPGFTVIAVVYVVLATLRTYIRQLLQIRWRRWMTGRLLADWLADRAYYTLGLAPAAADASGETVADNPDQRIAEDLQNFTDDTLRLGLDLLSKVVTVASFAGVLWTLSGSLTVWGVTIPGYLLFVAIIYAVLGSGLAHLVGRPLAAIEFYRQKLEGNFRFALVRIRENLEGVALLGGEASELRLLGARVDAVVGNVRAMMARTFKLNLFINTYSQLAGVFPFIVAAPRYFSGGITLGGITRIADAFGQFQDALSWFVNSYADLAKWRATVDRLAGFQAAITAARRLAPGTIRTPQSGSGAIALAGLTLALPDGRVLLDRAELTLPRGRSTVVSGPSGAGKSTLFRAIAGIWPFAQGAITLPPAEEAGRVMVLPQQPYIPLGTLRAIVAYPADPAGVPDDAIRMALDQAGLGALIPELDAAVPWSRRLSGGEQQRVAVARALLQRPDWLFLDEATASLDPAAEAALYATLRTALPNTTIVSIAHRPELVRLHDAALTLADGQLRPALPAAGLSPPASS